MNRAERRRLGRTEKPKTYTLTDVDIQRIKSAATADAFKMLMAIPMMVLNDRFRFDRIQMDDFVHYSMGWATDVQNGVVTLKEVLDLCEEETGLKIKEK